MATKNRGDMAPYAIAGVLAVIALLIGLLLLQVHESGASDILGQHSQPNSVSVYARGFATAKPEEARLSLYLNSTSPTSAMAVSRLSGVASALNSTIYRYVNGNMSAIKSESLTVYATLNRTNATVYTASEYVSVTMPSLSRVNELVRNLSTINGVEIYGITAQLSPMQETEMLNAAIRDALANASSQAELVINGASIVSQNTTINSYYVTPYPIYSTGMSASPSGPGQLFFNGTSTVSASVSVTYRYT